MLNANVDITPKLDNEQLVLIAVLIAIAGVTIVMAAKLAK